MTQHDVDVIDHLAGERDGGEIARRPLDLGPGEIERLRAAGLDDADIVDVINGAAFFHRAHRLMLSLGEPEVPTRTKEHS